MVNSISWINGFAALLVFSTIVLAWVSKRQYYAVRVLIVFWLCMFAYLVRNFFELSSSTFFVLYAISQMLPVTFILLCDAWLFGKLKPSYPVMSLGVIELALLSISNVPELWAQKQNVEVDLAWYLGTTFQLFLTALGVYYSLRAWFKVQAEGARKILLIAFTSMAISLFSYQLFYILNLVELIPYWVSMLNNMLMMGLNLILGLVTLLIAPVKFEALFHLKRQR